jgi:hypothetical protein
MFGTHFLLLGTSASTRPLPAERVLYWLDDQLMVVVLANLAEAKPEEIAAHAAEMCLASR